MKYEIKGSPMPVVTCYMGKGEKMITQSGGMSWMSSNIKMETSTNGGIGKMIGRALTKDKLFQNIYTCEGENGTIAFASSFPGDIMAIQINEGEEYICEKSSFLASTPGITMSVFFQQKIRNGIWGGEGFVMQKFTGKGIVFIEIDGSAMKFRLGAGEKMAIDTGHLVMMSSTCKLDIQMIKGVKNLLFGGEGVFNTTVEGPGEMILQSMPICNLAGTIIPYIPTKTNQ